MNELRAVKPIDLHAYWPVIREGVEIVKRECKQEDGWIAEDVYASLQSGNSALYVGFTDGAYVGFIVLTPMRDWDGMRLHVWALYYKGGGDFLAEFGGEFDAVVRQAAPKRLTMYTARERGFERRLAQYGFRPTMTIFQKDL